MRNDISNKIDKPLVQNKNLGKIKNINGYKESIFIQKRVNELYNEISDRYKVKEEEIYEKLYLKVRKMFLEEDR
jgi:hypothetical protein